MRAAGRSRRVAIAVEPRLLADTLMRAVRRPDIEVTIWPDEGIVRADFDIAVVRGTVPDGVHAEVVIRLPEDDEGAPGSITTPRGTEAAVVTDLRGLMQTLQRFLR